MPLNLTTENPHEKTEEQLFSSSLSNVHVSIKEDEKERKKERKKLNKVEG